MRTTMGLAAAAAMLATTMLAGAAALARTGPSPGFTAATASGVNGHVKVFDGVTGAEIHDVRPYDAQFAGGVRVAVGDINNDGIGDLVTGAGPGGGPHVKVFDGSDGRILHDFHAYDAGFGGGVRVAVGDVNGDGRDDVIVGAGAGGGPHVKAFSGDGGAEIRSFFAFDGNFTGGVSVASGDVLGDGRADIIVGAGPGGNGHIKVFDGRDLSVHFDFLAFDGFTGGVSLATGNYFGTDALIVGAGPGGGPHVKVFALSDLRLLDSFFAFDAGFTGGVSVGAGRLDGRDMLFVGMATNGGSVAMFDVDAGRGVGKSPDLFAVGAPVVVQPFGTNYMGGINVAGFAPGVPEPAVWLQLIAGFGLSGAALRARRRVAIA